MKSALLATTLAAVLAAPTAFAAEPPAPAAAGTPAASARAADAAAPAAKIVAARTELGELRQQMQTLSQRMAELSVELGDVGPRAYAFRYLGDPDRAMIGVVLSPDAHGARISAVTPGAAAAREGLHDGDLIVAIDGKTLDTRTPQSALGDARARLAGLKENQKVRIEYRRGNRSHDTTLTAERRKAWNWAQLMDGQLLDDDFMQGDFMHGDPEHPLPSKDFDKHIQAAVARSTAEATRAASQSEHVRAQAEHAQHIASRVDMRAVREAAEHARRAMRFAMPWWGLNLAPVNAELGRYFGTDHGALVIAADHDALPGVQAGDVITGIAGEPVRRPEDALRALRDQTTGGKVKVDVLRDRKPVTLSMRVPKYKSIFNLPPLPPSPPTPPAPPTPPTPPSPVSAPTPPSPPAAVPADVPAPPLPPAG